MCFTWLHRAVAHVFGDQVLLISNDPVLAFPLAFGHLGEFIVFLFFFFFFDSRCSCVGVDNALIKGEIANTRLIYALVVRICNE